jgi:hypothetical protein
LRDVRLLNDPGYRSRVRHPIAIGIALLSLCGTTLPHAADAEELFALTRFASQGRSVAAELADLDGDGRDDLFIVALEGLPPAERRTIRVYLQNGAGGFPEQPSHTLGVPRWSAVYDVSDVRPESPGEELILLRPDGVTVQSLASATGGRWHLSVPGPTTVGLADDERGFEPFRIAYHEFDSEPWLLVPQIGRLTALTVDGEVKAELAIPRRANYFIIPSNGLIALETDFQIFLDVPKLALGDVDGDGSTDIVSSTRHELRVFLRREDGGFDVQPSRTLPLGLMTPRDQIRGTGGVASEVRDIDGDGRLDLLITHVKGSFADAEMTVYVFMNQEGGWKLAQPDQKISRGASVGSNALIDIDRDGRLELLRLELDFSLLELIELFLSREIDVELSLHRLDGKSGFVDRPWVERKVSVPVSFETFRTKGFIPTAATDMNADGLPDFVSSGEGEKLEIRLGDARKPFAKLGGRQKMSTAGVIHFGDIDADGLVDFVIFDPHNFDVPVQVGRNLGRLKGTPAGIRSRAR